jgi:hypothetical protein
VAEGQGPGAGGRCAIADYNSRSQKDEFRTQEPEEYNKRERRALQEGKGKASLGEPTKQLGMSGNEFVNRRLEGGLGQLPVSLLQEGDELFHCGLLRRGKLQNELTQVSMFHASPEQEKNTPAVSRQQRGEEQQL